MMQLVTDNSLIHKILLHEYKYYYFYYTWQIYDFFNPLQ
jgi:hypothetical protein